MMTLISLAISVAFVIPMLFPHFMAIVGHFVRGFRGGRMSFVVMMIVAGHLRVFFDLGGCAFLGVLVVVLVLR